MKRLFVIRHGKAVPHGTCADIDRGLQPRGIADVEALGRHAIKARKPGAPWLVSGAQRTKETAELLRKAWNAHPDEMTLEPDAYLASDRAWLQWINAWSDDHDTGWIVGHNPGVSDLVARLTDQHIWLPTSGMAEIELHIDGWAEAFAGLGRLRSMHTPKSLFAS